MGTVRTLVALVGLAVCPLAVAAEVLPDLRDIAACTGRLSAVTEDAWNDGGVAADLATFRRDGMADVLDAITPAGAETQVMAWRVAAKAAQAALLAEARFGGSDAAARRAAMLVADCLMLVS